MKYYFSVKSGCLFEGSIYQMNIQNIFHGYFADKGAVEEKNRNYGDMEALFRRI